MGPICDADTLSCSADGEGDGAPAFEPASPLALEEDPLPPEEAADALRIGENAIYELLNSKKLSAYKNGRNWLIPKEAVRKYVVEQSKLE